MCVCVCVSRLLSLCFFFPICFQIRVVNAFRMSLDARYDNRSMSSVHSIHSLQNARMVSKKPPTFQHDTSTDLHHESQSETQF